MSHVLEHDRFPTPRWGDNQGSLAFAHGGEQIDHSIGQRLSTTLQPQPFLGIDRGQGVETLDLRIILGFDSIDIQNLADTRALLASVPKLERG